MFKDSDIAVGNVIAITGAREHNLKNLSLEIPRDKFVVITGVSGSICCLPKGSAGFSIR
jgi:excinuclease UvrABC ATPase subunit